jgi:hypothetical protein
MLFPLLSKLKEDAQNYEKLMLATTLICSFSMFRELARQGRE